jgi:hypothetical protein
VSGWLIEKFGLHGRPRPWGNEINVARGRGAGQVFNSLLTVILILRVVIPV